MVGTILISRGRLLVATPDLRDPNFVNTVILLLEHNEDGSLGVVLNRPSSVTVDDALPVSGSSARDWRRVASDPPLVFAGGPVQPHAVITFARVPTPTSAERFQTVLGDAGVIGIGDGTTPPEEDVTALRVFVGYAGWGGDQLVAEIEEGAWFVVDGRPEDPFTDSPEVLWREVLRRQGGVFTTVTANPAAN